MWRTRLALGVLAWCVAIAGAAAQNAATPQIVTIPALLSGTTRPINLQAGLWRPPGDGPFPLAIINHGTARDQSATRSMGPDYYPASRWFVSQGYAVVTPLRRGYGKSDGPLSETAIIGTPSCSSPDYYGAGRQSARDVLAVLDYMRKQPYVDASRIVLVGHSAGGWATLAALGYNPPVIGAIVFAPGRGGSGADFVCRPEFLVASARTFGQEVHIPMIWFSSENDHFFNLKLARAMFDAFSAKHPGDDTFVAVPAFGSDGHAFINYADGLPLWTSEVQAFLAHLATH